MAAPLPSPLTPLPPYIGRGEFVVALSTYDARRCLCTCNGRHTQVVCGDIAAVELECPDFGPCWARRSEAIYAVSQDDVVIEMWILACSCL